MSILHIMQTQDWSAGAPVQQVFMRDFAGTGFDNNGANINANLPVRTSDDTLYAQWSSFGVSPNVDALNPGWFNIGYTNFGFEAWRRQATNDANDNFVIPASTDGGAVVISSIASADPGNPNTEQFNGGPISSGNSATSWPMFVNNFGTGQADCLNLAFMWRNTFTVNGYLFTPPEPPGFSTYYQFQFQAPVNGTVHLCYCFFNYEAVSAALPAYTLTQIPNANSSYQCQYTRWRRT